MATLTIVLGLDHRKDGVQRGGKFLHATFSETSNENSAILHIAFLEPCMSKDSYALRRCCNIVRTAAMGHALKLLSIAQGP